MKLLKMLIVLGVLALVLSACSEAKTEVATFESLYEKSLSIGPLGWIIAGIVAFGAAVIVVLSAGTTAPPMIAACGTWIGGMAGLHGAAATSYGLALLGGGSLASGGLGMAGGVAVLTAAFTFGTEVVIDHGVTAALNTYEHHQFVEASKHMLHLPIPRNLNGPKIYQEACKDLKSFDAEMGYQNEQNKALIGETIETLQAADSKKLSKKDQVRVDELLSILYFNTSLIDEAKERAGRAMNGAEKLNVKKTFPSFVFACCELYEDEPDISSITKKNFRSSILEEPENNLIPYCFALYADRVFYRFNDRAANPNDILALFEISKEKEIRKYAGQNYLILLSKSIIRLKQEQQIIYALCRTENETIRNAPLTLERVEDSLSSYKTLLKTCFKITREITESQTKLKREQKETLVQTDGLLVMYGKDIKNLEDEISIFRKEQGPDILVPVSVVVVLLLGGAVCFVIFRARRKNKNVYVGDDENDDREYYKRTDR